ncbi:MAG: quinol:cytochrome C oxidoreductase, partial [Planctomycetota bacterium]
IVGVIGIATSFVLLGGPSLDGIKRFSYSYLTSFCFILTICLGCLFFVTVMHLTRAGWSVTVRRIAEIYAACLPALLILFLPILIPVLFQFDWVYSWVTAGWSIHGSQEAKDAVLGAAENAPPLEALKAAYLNPGFFGIRTVVYFFIWWLMSSFFLRNSLKQDQTGDKALTLKMQKWSAPMMIMFAATLTFASFDYEMSLSPLWFSTMFPVYIFAGGFLGGLATMTLTALMLQRSGRVTDEITVEHYHDLAKLMFAFVFFWGYIAFSQFMLIWYANIPEETFWFAWRINQLPGQEGLSGWQYFSLFLVFGHIIIPFLGLMARTVRRSKSFLFFAAIYILIIHWIDHYWIIMPEAFGDHRFTFSGLGVVADLACAVGLIGLFMAIFFIVCSNKPLVPLRDPRLGESLNFHNP